MGRGPSVDRMSIWSERQTREACFFVRPGVWRVCHSLATARKLGVVELAGVLPLLTCLSEADLGIRAEA